MRGYIIRRLLLAVPTLLIVSLIVFISIRLIPGSVVDVMITEMGGTITQESDAALREMIEHRLGLDVPLHVQYGRWFKGIVLYGDLGESMWTRTSVTSEISAKLPVTIELGLIALMVALLVSLPIGILEQIFLLPGTGRYFLMAALKRDYTAISGIVMVLAVFIVFINLAIDLLYGYLDPRIKYR